jgi:hypothetical protein
MKIQIMNIKAIMTTTRNDITNMNTSISEKALKSYDCRRTQKHHLTGVPETPLY